MPEGPEIRRVADALESVLKGKKVTEIWFAFPTLKTFEKQLHNTIITAVEPHGKALLTRFNNGLNIYSHNQLYGRWIILPVGESHDSQRQLRLAIHNQEYSALLYSASDIEVLKNNQLATHPFLSKLGPDLLDPVITLDVVLDQFKDARFQRKQLGSLLTDQSFLAGMGNYLRCEILFVAGLHPTHRPMDCSQEQLQKLADTCLQLTRQSYRTAGITNDLERADTLRSQGLEKEEYRFYVFRRAEQPCYLCNTPILKEQSSGQACYRCPHCQPPPCPRKGK